jgi:hypothetical protein
MTGYYSYDVGSWHVVAMNTICSEIGECAKGSPQGTGGRSHYRFGAIRPNSEARNDDAFGVLKLSLHPGAYGWRFVPASGATFSDSGSAPCH